MVSPAERNCIGYYVEGRKSGELISRIYFRNMSQPPNLDWEKRLSLQGYELIAGIDEVGRGALAGPVVAAAVILPRCSYLPWFKLVRDSKEISSKKRENLFPLIRGEATAVGIGIVSEKIIDATNILKATQLAMKQAVEKLPSQPHFLIIDRLTLPHCSIPQEGITRGDQLCLSIACASIVAKVTRDHLIEQLDEIYPGYDFARHKGYGTRRHVSCLQCLGPSPIHRLSFAPVKTMVHNHSPSAIRRGD